MNSREGNLDDPYYQEWRNEVLKRDKYECQMPGCSRRRRRMEVHHIQRWADAPYLRYEVDNGICLCRSCHYSIRNNEHNFISLFMEIIKGKK